MTTTLQIHRVTRVTAEVTKKRNMEACADHDVYKLEIVSEGDVEDEPSRVLKVTLFAEPDADIGLGPLVDEEAAQ